MAGRPRRRYTLRSNGTNTIPLDLPDGAHLSITCDPVFGHLVVHRPPSGAYLCVEPVSHVANGFNLAARGVAETGTRFLEPGETLQGQIRFSLDQA